MARTPDRRHGKLYEEEIQLDDRSLDGPPLDERNIRYLNGAFQGKDAIGVFNLRSGGATVAHAAQRELIHFISEGPAETFASGAYKETLGVPWSTSEIWYVSTLKLKKIVELSIVRNGNRSPATETWRVYDVDGVTVLATVTDTFQYAGPFETGRVRVIA